MITLWFADIFPTFAPPSAASDSEKLKIKTTLQLWILQFGPASLKHESLWQPLVAAFNNGSADWTKYLGWAVSPRGYTLDGTTPLEFPAALDIWLGTENRDLFVLNMKSTLCNTAGCPFPTQCYSIDQSLACSAPQ
jgi:hypothetical protein